MYFLNMLYKNVQRACTLEIFLNHNPSKRYFSEVSEMMNRNILLNVLRNVLISDIFLLFTKHFARIKFSFQDFFSKCEQIHWYSHLLNKSWKKVSLLLQLPTIFQEKKHLKIKEHLLHYYYLHFARKYFIDDFQLFSTFRSFCWIIFCKLWTL